MGGFIMNYEPMKEIANYLQRPEDEQNIETLERIEDDGKFFLPLPSSTGKMTASVFPVSMGAMNRVFLPNRS